jgi:hypothetical protein
MISPVPSAQRVPHDSSSGSCCLQCHFSRTAASIVAASLHAGITTDTRGQRAGAGGASRSKSGTPRRNNNAAIAVNPQ